MTPRVAEQFGALETATTWFADLLDGVPEGGWSDPTPNPGWTVRDLVNHVVGGNRRYALLLDGAPTREVEALRDLDHLGANPPRAFQETSELMLAAFRRPGALDGTVHHRRGDRTGHDLLVMRVLEHALHGWDLARAIDADDLVDVVVVRVLLGALDTDPGLLARSGYVSTAIAVDADPQARLLALTGRAL